MTATRKFLLVLLCTTASMALAAQDAKDDASKKDETQKDEQKTQTPASGQMPGFFGMPGQGQNPWMFGGTPGGDADKNTDKDGNVKMTEYRIYIGLNDVETREQRFGTERYLETLKDVCRSYKAAFSMDIEEGGCYHEDGEYTEETSLVLVLIDIGRDQVQGIAKDLCTLFHQESVLVTENVIDGRFIR